MKEFPVVTVEGSNYDVGVAIGTRMRESIQTLLAHNKKLFAPDYASLLKKSSRFLAKTVQYFPQYVEEVEGIAHGAQVSVEDTFLSTNREIANFDPSILDPNHCTIIAIPDGNSYIVGHNEDWDAQSLSYLYLLDATINGTKIFGLNYCNDPIGASIAVNGYGLVQAVNEVYHTDSQFGVPKNYIARAVLDCKTLEEVEVLMKHVPRAAGFNHVCVQGSNIWNFETTALQYEIEKISGRSYHHTNHYVTKMRELDLGNEESRVRYEKVRASLPGMREARDIMTVLSDKTEPQVCRPGTIGSVVVEPKYQRMYVAFGQPTPETYKEYKY